MVKGEGRRKKWKGCRRKTDGGTRNEERGTRNEEGKSGKGGSRACCVEASHTVFARVEL